MNAQDFLAQSPLRSRHEAAAARESGRRAATVAAGRGAGDAARESAIAWIPWGNAAEVLAVCDCVETEYASIRRGAAVCDLPQRGTLEVRGAERIDFLQRMLTQDLRQLGPGRTARAFWLNRKGRIEADLLLWALEDRIVIDLSRSVAAPSCASLGAFLFSEDVQVEDRSGAFYRLAVHGPQALDVLGRCGMEEAQIAQLAAADSCTRARLAGAEVIAARSDALGVPGIDITLAVEDAPRVWDAWTSLHDVAAGGVPRARTCGWLAMNIARIEAGEPLFEVDFGTDALPHETGVFDSRVSLDKGCYLGQEIVARMQSLGKPKQVVRALRVGAGPFPVAGAPVFAPAASGGLGDEVGVVTSSTASPMLGAATIAFATIRQAHAAAGTRLLVLCEGQPTEATIADGLRLVGPGAGTAHA